MNEQLEKEGFWSEAWQQHIEVYLKSPPRTGRWLRYLFPNTNLSFLEIAGGSCRDSRYLADRGYLAIGSDFDNRTLDYLRQRFAFSKLRLQREDAFSLSLADKSVDVSFHNGFWVCYRDNESIVRSLREQERVTRKYLIILVHNAKNKKLVSSFKQKSKADSLYDIRFFTVDELKQIVNTSGIHYKRLRIEKFGGAVDFFHRSETLNRWFPYNHIMEIRIPSLYSLLPWAFTERIACILELE